MKQAERDLIKEKMSVLIQQAKGFTIGRAAAMCWMGFDVNGAQYALHIQCAFRFRTAEEVLVGNLDMFEPTRAMEDSSSFDWNTFDWDVQGFNRYDEWTLQWKKEGRQAVVEAVEVSDFGDLTIRFSGGLVLEVFANNAQNECWRFFERHAKEHLVVTARGMDD